MTELTFIPFESGLDESVARTDTAIMRKGAVRLHVASRCPDVVRVMTTTAEGWHCSACSREVLDLRDKTREEARELVRRHADPHGACIAVRADAAGRSVFVQEAVASLKRAASGVALAASLAACGGEPVDAHPVASDAVTESAATEAIAVPSEPAPPSVASSPPSTPAVALVPDPPTPPPPSASASEPGVQADCDAPATAEAAPRRRVRRARPGTTSDVMGMTAFAPGPSPYDPYDW